MGSAVDGSGAMESEVRKLVLRGGAVGVVVGVVGRRRGAVFNVWVENSAASSGARRCRCWGARGGRIGWR